MDKNRQNEKKNNKSSYLSNESDDDTVHVVQHKETHLSEATNVFAGEDYFEKSRQEEVSIEEAGTNAGIPSLENKEKFDNIINDSAQKTFNLSDMKSQSYEAKVEEQLSLNSAVETNSSSTNETTSSDQNISSINQAFPQSITDSPIHHEDPSISKNNEIKVGEKQYKEPRKIPGLGFIKGLLGRLYTCVGCLLFIVAIAIVLFVYIVNI